MTSIALITSSFPRLSEGKASAGAFVADFCAALGGHVDLHVVAPGLSEAVEQTPSYTVHRFLAGERPLSQRSPLQPLDWLPIASTLASGRRVTRGIVREHDVDAIVALWAVPCGLWALQAARDGRLPYYVWCLGSDIWTYGKNPVTRPIVKHVLSKATHVYADGTSLIREIRDFGLGESSFLPSSRNLGVPQARPRNTAPYRLVFVGRWHENKGVDLLLESLTELDSQDWERIERVDIYGGGPLEGAVRAGVAELAAGGAPVHAHGYADRQEARQALDDADWVLLPSRRDSIPVVFSDAMQMGRPMISTPVGDLPEIFSQDPFGVMADKISASAFAAAIRRATAGSALATDDALARLAGRFDVSATAASLVQAIGATRPAVMVASS